MKNIPLFILLFLLPFIASVVNAQKYVGSFYGNMLGQTNANPAIATNGAAAGPGAVMVKTGDKLNLTNSIGLYDLAVSNVLTADAITATTVTGDGSGLTDLNAATVTVVDGTDSTSFFSIFDSATGSLAVKTDANALYNASTGLAQFAALAPVANDGGALGTTALQFSDLFLAEGGVINFDNGDATLTQVGDVVTLAGAALTVPQNNYTTNSGSAVSPNMLVSYALLSTNAAFKILLPTGVDTGQTLVQTSVLMVTNTTAAAVAITVADAPVKSTGTWYVTNVSAITATVYPKVVTNYICLPIF